MKSTPTAIRRPSYATLTPSTINNDNTDISCLNCQNENIKAVRRRRSSTEPKRYWSRVVGRFFQRKGRLIASGINVVCNNIGKLRVVDVALFVGFVAKFASIYYSRQFPAGPSSSPTVVYKSNEAEEVPNTDKSFSSKWQKIWAEHKMPFQSPLLYRREDDDYSFGYDSYLDDDQVGHYYIQPKQTTNNKFRGMLLRDPDFMKKKQQLNANGYVIVDDILYNSNRYRETTESALRDSVFHVNQPDVSKPIDESYPAFEFRNDDEIHRHYIVDDDWDFYYSLDDDVKRGTLGMGLKHTDDDVVEDLASGDSDKKRRSVADSSGEHSICTLPEFYRLYKPTCNEMHALLSGYNWLIGDDIYARRWKKRKLSTSDKSHVSKYLAHGYYRDAFLFQQSFVTFKREGNINTQWDEVVFKTMHHMYETNGAVSNDDTIDELGLGFDPNDKYTFTHYKEYMRMDAMVMEQLTSSPRAADIYSHCAMSSVIEFAPIDMEDYIMPTIGYTPKKILRRGAKHLDEWDGPLNSNISPEEKLEIALEMAKCLAVMHGYASGPIVNVDVQVGQFFRGRDGILKIVDFNRAEPLMYDTHIKQYCKWTNGEPTDGQVSHILSKLVSFML